MFALLIAFLSAGAAQAPDPAPPTPRPLPRGPSQPATGAARPELVRARQLCSPSPPLGTRFIFTACFNRGDYPLSAYEAREQGVVGVRVAIDASGRATGCEVAAPSGSAALDRATCELLERRIIAAYALDGEGRPAATTLSGQVAWQLPSEPPRDNRNAYVTYFMTNDYPPVALRAGDQGLVAFSLHVSAEGRVTTCEITRSSGSPALDAAACRIMQVRARYYPARDADGRQIPGVDTDGFIIWRLPDEEGSG